MKINQIIREKRKVLSLTQEQIAELLGVSTPAVNKWEKGSTYPDITLLPAIARLLRIDLNTLMSFNEDLTDIEIEKFVNELDKVVREQNYQTAFQRAIDKIHEYPTCDELVYSAILYLDGARFLYNVAEPEQYQETFETFYQRLSENENPEIRDLSIGMLISYARKKEAYSSAEELINKLPFSQIDREEQLAILYQEQKKYSDAEKLWEHRILKGVTEIQTALVNMIEIALHENRHMDADFIADKYAAITRLFSFPEWQQYNAHLQLAIERKDKDTCISILSKMLPAMRKKWNSQDCKLYQNAEGTEVTALSSKVVDSLCEELNSKDEFAFIRDCADFKKLMAQMGR
ncbi:MAG: helix-turn-helix transcriptional regulator [Peptococcaceae bacterium]|nr:helix-turn-helix transcriptional regulator [Peptococcaceae bacterium]